MALTLSTPLMYLKGVGPARAAMLESKGLKTVEDLLAYPPFCYEDRSNVKPIAQLAPGEMATVMVQVRTAHLARFRRRDLGLFEATFGDSSQQPLLAKWFHAPYLAGVLAPGQKVALYGKVELDSYTGELSMLHPEFEVFGEDEPGGTLPGPVPALAVRRQEWRRGRHECPRYGERRLHPRGVPHPSAPPPSPEFAPAARSYGRITG